MLKSLSNLAVTLGVVTVITLLYALITISSGMYQSKRQLWIFILIALGASYVFAGLLLFIFHLSWVPIALIVTILLFVAGNWVNERQEQEDIPQLLEQEQEDDPQLSEVE